MQRPAAVPQPVAPQQSLPQQVPERQLPLAHDMPHWPQLAALVNLFVSQPSSATMAPGGTPADGWLQLR